MLHCSAETPFSSSSLSPWKTRGERRCLLESRKCQCQDSLNANLIVCHRGWAGHFLVGMMGLELALASAVLRHSAVRTVGFPHAARSTRGLTLCGLVDLLPINLFSEHFCLFDFCFFFLHRLSLVITKEHRSVELFQLGSPGRPSLSIQSHLGSHAGHSRVIVQE